MRPSLVREKFLKACKWNMGLQTQENKTRKRSAYVNTPLPLVIKLRKDIEDRASELLALHGTELIWGADHDLWTT